MPVRPTFRFAPSPNGDLHLGHAYSALLNAQMARSAGGRLLLRIEDIDRGRSREAFIAQALSDLAWLGLHWEEPVRRQSEHFDDYAAAISRLDALGVLYPCFATRADIEAAARSSTAASDPDGAPLYPGLWRGVMGGAVDERLRSGDKPALRLDMARALRLVDAAALTIPIFEANGGQGERGADPARWGDAVIVRKDTPASYHLAVVVDDALQGVTHVVRGADLEAATDLHRLLQALLGLPVPRYHHHALILDRHGEKLAKSRGAPSLRALRAAGSAATEVRGRLGFSSGSEPLGVSGGT